MSNQIVISSGAKVRNLDGVLTGSTGVVGSVPLGAANGVATLDSGGKVPVSQLPSSVVTYLGTWDAATNTPTLTNGTGDAGDMYICNVAGTVNFGAGPITFAVGDWVLYGSGTWQKSNGQNGTVTSVAVTESGDALSITGSPITTAGTINIGFAGNSGQYINGEGNLTTFPSLITEAQNLVTEVYNSTGATLTKGTIVYINGGQGNLPTITKAIATGDSTSAQTYGVVRANISNNNNGYVTVIGSLTDIDTQSYAAGTQLYLSGTTAGEWTSTKPSAPIHLVYVGIVVRSHPTQGVVEVKIQNGYELDELHDVAISSVANNDGIFYNSSNDLWENKTIAEVLGYTPQAQLTLTTTGTSGAATLVGSTLNIPQYTDAYTGTVTSVAMTVPTGLSVSGSPITTSGTLAVSLASGYSIPTTAKQTEWDTAYTNRITSLTTTGSSGAATLTSNTLNIPTYTLAGLGGQPLATNLTSLSGLTYASTSFVKMTAAGTFTLDTNTYALASALSGYLPLSGGTLTDTLTITNPSIWANLTLRGFATEQGGQINFFGAATKYAEIVGEYESSTNGRLIFRTTRAGTSTTAMTISSAGNVLINTLTDAGYKLDVAGSGRFNNTQVVNTTSSAISEVTSSSGRDALTLYYDGTYGAGVGLNYGTNPNHLVLYYNGATALKFNTSRAATFSNSVTVNTGTTNQNVKIFGDKVGISRTSDAAEVVYFSKTNTLGGDGTANIQGYDGIVFRTQGTETVKLTIAATGAATFSSSVTAGARSFIKGSAGYLFDVEEQGSNKARFQSYVVSNEVALIAGYDTTAVPMTFYAGGSERMRITSGGNVGIGQSNPTVLLDLKKAHSAAYGQLIDLINLNGYFPGYDVDSQRAGIAAGVPPVSFGNTSYGWMSFRTKGSDGYLDRMIINPNGTILVNTTTGVSGGGTLQVNGNVNINGVFQINGTTIGGGGGSGVTGSGTTNYIPKWTGGTSLGNSLIYDSGSAIALGNTANGAGMAIEMSQTGSTPRIDLIDTSEYTGQFKTSSKVVTLQNNSNNPLVFGTNATERVRIFSDGNFGIGTGATNNGYKLQINGSASFAYGYTSVFRGSSGANDILVGNTGSTFYVGGSVSATGGFFDTSDSRLKTLITDNHKVQGIENVTAKLYIKNGKEELGYYAQDLQEILPSAVVKGADGFLTLSYSQVHTAKIAQLEAEVAELKELIKKLL